MGGVQKIGIDAGGGILRSTSVYRKRGDAGQWVETVRGVGYRLKD